MSFRFDEKKHAYFLNDKPLLGTTSVLSVISKPQLIQWSANEAVRYVRENSETSMQSAAYLLVSEKTLDEAETAHRKKKESAGDFGTEVHKMLETWIKESMKGHRDFTRLTTDDPKAKAFNNFLEWVEKNNVEFLASEKQVYSEKLWLAGTLDFIAKVGDKTFLGDFKTSSGIYFEMFLQTSAYQMMLGDEFKIDGHIIVNLKKNGEIETKESYAYETNKQGFLGALQLYKVLNDIQLN